MSKGMSKGDARGVSAPEDVCLEAGAWHRWRMTDASFRPPPDAASLKEAAMRYVARYATTEAGLRFVLNRRIDRWARLTQDRDGVAERVATAKAAIPAIVARMTELGLVNDAAFAESRARSLSLGGKSRRAILAKLAVKGIGAEQARAALPEEGDGELVSALVLARKRRIGPFRVTDAGDRNKEMAVLARAGFPRDVAARALAMAEGEAEAAIIAARV